MLYNMISGIQKLKKAREMRLDGRSLTEISREVGVSRSTLSYWLRDITLNTKQSEDLKNRVAGKISRGRLNAVISRRSSRIFKENKAFEHAVEEFKKLHKEPLFMLGLALYRVHGAKKGSSFQYSDSDQDNINIMISWIRKYLATEQALIRHRKYGSYKRIDISRVDVLRRVMAWQKQLIKYYGRVINV